MADDAGPTSLLDIAVQRASRDASAPLLITLDDGPPHDVHVLTYADVLGRAEALAVELAAAGVVPGDRVGCYLSNSPSWVVASLAVWMNGAAVAAAGTLLPSNEAATLFDMAGVSVVVAVADAPGLPDRFSVLAVDEGGEISGSGSRFDRPGVQIGSQNGGSLPAAEDVAVAIFTSGTTGRPKGITHTHGDIVAAARRVAAAYARTSDYRPDPAPPDRPPGVLFNPFGHMAGYSRLAFRMWTGRALVIVSRFSVAATKALLARYPLDTLQLTPTMIHMLATADEDVDLRSVKYVTSGTAPLSIATRERFEARFAVPVMQAYGMTEIGAVAQERFDDVVAGRRGPGSVGRLAAGVEVRFRTLDDGDGDGGFDPHRPEGEGEILVRTDEASDEFIGGAPVPVDEEGWFATGDVGRLEDGILYITGRVQEKIIVGGFNVYPAEVEDALRRSPLVLDAVVVGVPDDRLGERPVAGVVWAGPPDPDALTAAARGELAAYKVPRAYFPLDAVPLTPRDKVDRRRAAALAAESVH